MLEDRVRAHALVGQCLVVGDGQPFIAALVTIDPEAFPDWAAAHGKPGDVAALVDDPDLRAEVQRAVDDANAAVSRAESIRKFVILPGDWTEEGGQLTPSLKLKRNVVVREHQRRHRRPVHLSISRGSSHVRARGPAVRPAARCASGFLCQIATGAAVLTPTICLASTDKTRGRPAP